MTGGTFIRNRAQAQRLAIAMRSEGFSEEPPEPGQYVSLIPCILPCPRVELSLSNVSAAVLCMGAVSIGPISDKLAPMTWDAHSGHLPPCEKQRLVSKISRALSSDAVVEFFRKRQEERTSSG